MNSVTAVLLALVLIAVVLLIVWLVLRSRSSDLPRGSASSAAGAPLAPGTGTDRGPDARGYAPVAPAASGDPLDADDPGSHDGDGDLHAEDDERDAHDGDDSVQAPAQDAPAAAEEFVDPGLSELDEDGSSEAPESGDGDLTGTPPRTPAEAFGPADAHGDDVDHDAASRETSVLDERDADSTPLFRSIREELLGTGSAEEPDPVDHDDGVEAPEAPEPSDEHRRIAAVEAQENVWTETVTDEGVESGAAGTGPLDPTAEEEELSTTNDTTTEQVGSAAAPGAAGEHPPIRRISELHEVLDGGFGIGSAKALEDGAQPLGHPIKASIDTKTYQDLHSPWYDDTEPDVWFLDPGFAERAGFHRAE